jgi:hypothetical protein
VEHERILPQKRLIQIAARFVACLSFADMTGMTGMRIIDAILAGETGPMLRVKPVFSGRDSYFETPAAMDRPAYALYAGIPNMSPAENSVSTESLTASAW